MGPWCYVDPVTCHNQPFVDSLGGAYDACAATNDTTTYDTGACPCLPFTRTASLRLPQPAPCGHAGRCVRRVRRHQRQINPQHECLPCAAACTITNPHDWHDQTLHPL